MSSNNSKGDKKEANGRTFVSKGVSAPPEWWAEIESLAAKHGMNKSHFIRVGVNRLVDDLKVASVETRITPLIV